MNIQSLSIVVPNRNCVNKCKFCCARMHCEDYKNQMDDNGAFYDLYEKDYMRRLQFARDNGCNTVMLTGNSEPQQNRTFLQHFASMNERISSPFRWIELQTTGVLLENPYLRFLRNTVGVSTISLSVSSFVDTWNKNYIGAADAIYNCIGDICDAIKTYDFNLRLSLNLTDWFEKITPEEIFRNCKKLNADQVTFRLLYADGNNIQADWVRDHKVSEEYEKELTKYITENGKPLEKLPYGLIKYSLDGISVVIDDDCMSTEVKSDYKYLILRENCKLYSKWDDKASLIF